MGLSNLISKIIPKLGYTQGGVKMRHIDQGDIPHFWLKEFDIDGTKYSFVISSPIYIDFEGERHLPISLYIYRDKPKSFIQKIFSKGDDKEYLKFMEDSNTKKLPINFDNSIESKKQILKMVPSAIKSLEKEALDRINRMPDPSTLNENFFKRLISIPKAAKLAMKVKRMIDKGKDYDYIIAILNQDHPKMDQSKLESIVKVFWDEYKDNSSEKFQDQLDNLLDKPGNIKENMKNKQELDRWAKLADLPKDKPKRKKQQLDENIGGVVSIGAINNPLEREKAEYETVFEHYLKDHIEGLDETEDGSVEVIIANVGMLEDEWQLFDNSSKKPISKKFPDLWKAESFADKKGYKIVQKLSEKTESTGEVEEDLNPTDPNAHGNISDVEEDLMTNVEVAIDDLIAMIKKEANDIGGSFRSPGIEHRVSKLIKAKLQKARL